MEAVAFVVEAVVFAVVFGVAVAFGVAVVFGVGVAKAVFNAFAQVEQAVFPFCMAVLTLTATAFFIPVQVALVW